jgi:hypothetical protein
LLSRSLGKGLALDRSDNPEAERSGYACTASGLRVGEWKRNYDLSFATSNEFAIVGNQLRAGFAADGTTSTWIKLSD